MSRFFEQLRRGLRLRCPVCGQGKLFSGFFRMYQHCPVCHFTYEREEGYFSSSMAIDLVVSELVVAAAIIPLAANPAIPVLPVLLIGAPWPFLLPIILYWHSRSFWMSMDHYLNPTLGHPLSLPHSSSQEHRDKY